MPSASSHPPKLTRGHRRPTSPSTGSAENKSSAESPTSTRSLHDRSTLTREEARHRDDRIFEPNKLRERIKVEHALAHVGHWQGRRARYRGTRKNFFDLRRVAVVHNLHVIARQPAATGYQLAA